MSVETRNCETTVWCQMGMETIYKLHLIIHVLQLFVVKGGHEYACHFVTVSLAHAPSGQLRNQVYSSGSSLSSP